MIRRKGRKSSKRRGHTTHGYGSMKKHRHGGSRGGRGMAGTGKRADQKKSLINPAEYFGTSGFHSLRSAVRAINVQELVRGMDKWTHKNCVQKSGKGYTLNLTKAGVHKLLGAGNIDVPFTITVATATPRAIAKIEKAGGSVTVTQSTTSSKMKESNVTNEED